MQIDLQEPMILDEYKVSVGTADTPQLKYGEPLSSQKITKEGNAYFIKIHPAYTQPNQTIFVTVYYHGKPTIARMPPWDGGLIWKKDKQGNPFISIACQGLGASVWYPCKDIQSDEPDNGAMLHVSVPDSLTAVGNGRLIKQQALAGGKTRYSWQVTNPINNYNIVPYIGKYVHFSEVYAGKKGKLDMDYWVLDYNLDKAKKQFTDAPKMMKAFEYWFGPYPFYADGFKLVESPHLGMEHQSATAYGNGYQNGFYGSDLSETGWGMK